MEKISKFNCVYKTRLYLLCNLVFFVTVLSSCVQEKGQGEISIVKDGDRAVAIFIPSDFTKGVNADQLGKEISIRIAGKKENMLGEYEQDNYGVFFRPLIELTPGTNYQVLFKGNLISNLEIPEKTKLSTTSVSGIYPSCDTLPENLLKVYLNFSDPMRKGVSERYLTLLDGEGDTLRNIFLNLNTELWDEKGRQLTVWLDPGRIKRGLQPNEKDGNPLHTGSTYTINVSSDWTDINGTKLDKTYSKKFVTGAKDVLSPEISAWKINLPASGSKQAISISFKESLDHSLLYEAISIIQRDGQQVKGKIFVDDGEQMLLFYPEYHWNAGIYYIKVESRLEDLAGNNLNRLFDRDLMKDKPAGKEESYTRQFVIR